MREEGGATRTRGQPGSMKCAARQVKRGGGWAVGVADCALAPRFAATSTAQRSCERQRGEVGVAERFLATGYATTSTSPRTPFTRGTTRTEGVAGVARFLLPSMFQRTSATPGRKDGGTGYGGRMQRWARGEGVSVLGLGMRMGMRCARRSVCGMGRVRDRCSRRPVITSRFTHRQWGETTQ